MAKEIVPVETNLIVKKSNALMRCRWEIQSVYEPRLIAVLASKIHTDDEDFQDYEIPVTEILGQDYAGYTIKELAKVVDNLMGRVLTIFDTNGKGWAKYALFSMCRYVPEKGVIKLRFDKDLKPHYLNLKERFAQYSLAEFMSLPSVYSQRLYEILKSWDDRPEVEIALDDLHQYLDTPESYQKDFQQFKRRILEQAHKDIILREGSTLRYEWEPIKAGRAGKVVALRFRFLKSAALSARVKAAPKTKTAAVSEEDMKKQSRDCFQNRSERCANFYKSPSEIRGTKKKLCVFCITNGRAAIAREIEKTTAQAG